MKGCELILVLISRRWSLVDLPFLKAWEFVEIVATTAFLFHVFLSLCFLVIAHWDINISSALPDVGPTVGTRVKTVI